MQSGLWDRYLKDSKVYESISVLTGKELENEQSVRNRRFVNTCGDGHYKIYGGVSLRELLNYRTFLKSIGVKLRMQRTNKLALAFIKLRDQDILYRSTNIAEIEPLNEPARNIFELRQMRSSDIENRISSSTEKLMCISSSGPILKSRYSSRCRRKERIKPTWKIPPT